MPGLEAFLSNPDRVQGLSGFLLGMGQGLLQSQQAGMAPLASLAYGFGQGGQNVLAMRGLAQQERLRQLSEQLAQQKLQAAQREEARETAWRQALGAPWTNPDTGERIGGSLNEIPAATRNILAQMPADKGAAALLGLMKPKEDYTLGPGQARFDAAGNPIAAMPAKPERPVVVPPGSTAVDLEGNVLFKAPAKPDMLSPEAEAQRVRIAQQSRAPERPAAPVNVQMPDGSVRAFRQDDPALDEAIGRGGVKFAVQTPEIPRARADEVQADIDTLTGTLTNIRKMRETINADRSRGGIVGAARGLLQTGQSVILDVMNSVPAVREAMTAFSLDKKLGLADEGISLFFDPKLPEIDVAENSIAYGLARARKGSGRLNTDDVRLAKQDVNLKGLTSVDDALSKLSAIEAEIAGAAAAMQMRLPGKATAPSKRFILRNGELIEK